MPAMSAENPWVAALRRFAEFGDRVAVSSRGRTLTYAELAAQAEAVRAAVIEAGAKPGEPVAIVARNGPGVVVASYGVMASGAAEFVVDLNLGPGRHRLCGAHLGRAPRRGRARRAAARRSARARRAGAGGHSGAPRPRCCRRRRSIRAPGARRS